MMVLSEALQQRTTKASLFICPVAGADTIACLTGNLSAGHVRGYRHARATSLYTIIVFSPSGKPLVLIKRCSTVQMLNDTHERAQYYTKVAKRTSPICSTCDLLDLSWISATVRT